MIKEYLVHRNKIGKVDLANGVSHFVIPMIFMLEYI